MADSVKKGLRLTGRVILVLLALCVLFFGGMAAYHHLMLKVEEKELAPVGVQVEVDGHSMNVYTQGESRGKPTVVLLSGSGVASPIYDYKPLYSLLSEACRVAVVEKFGYGYADESALPRDVATMVEEDRKALSAAGEQGPFVLMPHSMSALEAIYWAQSWPEEVAGIVGLDMAVPQSYLRTPSNFGSISVLKFFTFFGMHRFPVFASVSDVGLTAEEYRQNQLLVARNSLNGDVYEECRVVEQNANTVDALGVPECPMLMFTTDLNKQGDYETWAAAQDDFAKAASQCRQVHLECGHELHHERPQEIAGEILEFLNTYE